MVAVGAVEPKAARIWMRSARPGRVVVAANANGAAPIHSVELEIPPDDPADGTAAAWLPATGALEPLTEYHFRATHEDGHVLGEGRFETAPADAASAPERFSFGLFSCHMPFDDSGRVTEDARAMLRAARTALERHDTKCVFTVGDQMYADVPTRISLYDSDHFSRVAPPGRERLQDCTAEEVRRLFQRRYRHFWNLEEWKALHASVPCDPVLDDHELVDNWGSHPEHSSPAWSSVRIGGRAACADYQHLLVADRDDDLPEHFDHVMAYGGISTYVLDLRSCRNTGAESHVLSPSQWKSLERFLETETDRETLLLALSVPLVHIPSRVAHTLAVLTPYEENFSDRWSSPGHRGDRDRLLRLLHEHGRRNPEQKLVLLSGDIHLGCAHEIRWGDGTPPVHELVSSGITHSTGRLLQLGTRITVLARRWIAARGGGTAAWVRRLPGEGGLAHNPCGGLNLGIIEFARPRPGARHRMRFLLYGHRGGDPVCRFRSREF